MRLIPAAHRWWWLIGGVAVVVAAALASIGLGGSADTPHAADPHWTGVAVTKGTVQVVETAQGSVVFGASAPLLTGSSGTVTWVPKQGAVIRTGQALLRVDDRPVILLSGTIPMYRTIGVVRRTVTVRADPSAPSSSASPSAPSSSSSSSSAPSGTSAAGTDQPATTTHTITDPLVGDDVAQLERDLAGLGYDGFDVDNQFTSATADAVRRWQHDTGQDETGRVERGAVVFGPAAVRIAKVNVRPGSPAGPDMLDVGGLTLLVRAAIAAGDQSWTPGVAVRLTTASGKVLPGRITTVGDPSSGAPASGGDGGDTAGADGAGGSASITAAVVGSAIGLGQAGAPVTVQRVLQAHRNVLSVPVTALVALAQGGFGVQLALNTSKVSITLGY